MQLYRLILIILIVNLVAQYRIVEAQDNVSNAEQRQMKRDFITNEPIRVRELGTITKIGDRTRPIPYQIDIDGELFSENKTRFGTTFNRLVDVDNGDKLQNALKDAQPGDLIYLRDGIYTGDFSSSTSGTSDLPIMIYGSRNAVLEANKDGNGYGFHLVSDYWILSGFTIQNSKKGIMLDNANYNIINGLLIQDIEDEGIHLRRNSSNNWVQYNWVRSTGLRIPEFGEGIYVGSAISNWGAMTDGEPDRSDNNYIINNLVGPNITAEGIDIKEGTTGGIVKNNTFISEGNNIGDSWIDTKGNAYEVTGNIGIRPPEDVYDQSYPIYEITKEWGQNNIVADNEDIIYEDAVNEPFQVVHNVSRSDNIVLPARPIRYTLAELITRFPNAFEQVGRNEFVLKENIVVGRDAELKISDIDKVYLLSSDARFVSITGYQSTIQFEGSADNPIEVQSWNLTLDNMRETEEIRAYIAITGGEMNATYTIFSYLGFEEGVFSGVAWQGYSTDFNQPIETSVTGEITNSQFSNNYNGAYTWEAVDMTWTNNTFSNNLNYGFSASDFTNGLLFKGNIVHHNRNHGIIFSRGAESNIIQDNQSYENAGHGIMIDDGSINSDLAEEDLNRYERLAPSNNNTITNNTIMNNKDAIVIEGGTNNIVENNSISRKHRYGIRVSGYAQNTFIGSNQIEGAERSSVFAYNFSDGNRITNNRINGGNTGLTLQNSRNTQIENNIIENIQQGAAIILKDNISGSIITGNVLRGSGVDAIRLKNVENIDKQDLINANDTTGWKYPPPALLAYSTLATWLLIFIIPIIMKVFIIIRHKFNYRYILKP